MRRRRVLSVLREVAVRLGTAIVTLFGASLAVFFGMHALPGDVALAIVGENRSPQVIHALRVKFGLERPLLEQYGTWLWGILHGDFGLSWVSGSSVWQTIGADVINTAILAGATIVILVPLAVVLGVVAAVNHERLVDNVIIATTLALIAVPEFVLGTLLVAIFAVWLGKLPAVSIPRGAQPLALQPVILVLPVVTLLAASAAGMSRMVRACMIDVMSSSYIQMARLKGVPEVAIIFRHALPNALGPTLQICALTIAVLAGGVIVVETVFQYPGMGSQLVDAVTARDIPTVEAIVMIITAVYVGTNLLANLGVVLLNPRLRRARR